MPGQGETKMNRLLFCVVAIAGMLVFTANDTGAQDVAPGALPGTLDLFHDHLAFSKDGRFLREVQQVIRGPGEAFGHVRAITYVAASGAIRHVLNLEPYTWLYSSTTDGRTAVISVGRDRPKTHAHLLLVDLEMGRTQQIPANWFDPGDGNPYAQISGDGRLVSAFSERGPEDAPVVVTVYNWRTKELIAKQSTGLPAGGFIWGGVTEDGQIEFMTNRTGGGILDLKTGRSLTPMDVNAIRSSDGAWVVEFPNFAYYDDPSRDVTIKDGMNGSQVGKLDLEIPEGEENWGWRGAFCGKSGRFIAATYDTVQAFEIPSGKKIVEFPPATWQDVNALKADPTVTVACSPNGKRVAIRSGGRLTLHQLK